MKNVTHSIIWRRLDYPGHESALLFFNDDSWHLQGTAVFFYNKFACRLNYQIICDSQWHTRASHVAGWVGNSLIESKLVVASDQRWFLNNEESPQVEGCIDVDLNFSPSTNLLPIRRLDLSMEWNKRYGQRGYDFPALNLNL